MKSRGLGYLLVTHENSAACMADGVARSTGRPGVLCVVPGPGVTNALTGIGEALLDSIPLVAIVGDVARGDKYKAFQVHELPQAGLLQQVTKGVFQVDKVEEIPNAVRQAFPVLAAVRRTGAGRRHRAVQPASSKPPSSTARHSVSPALSFDENAFNCAVHLLGNHKLCVGIYAGLGCMDFGDALTKTAEMLQKTAGRHERFRQGLHQRVLPAGSWLGLRAARHAHRGRGVQKRRSGAGNRRALCSEVSTGFYSIPPHRVVQVDANANNLGKVVKPEVCVHADAGVFLTKLLEQAPALCRPANAALVADIRKWKCDELKENQKCYNRCGVDPMALILAMRKVLCPDALVFVDVSATEHWAAEAMTTTKPPDVFQSDGQPGDGLVDPGGSWGPQRVHGGRPASGDADRRRLFPDDGDGDFDGGSAEGLPVKFFVLDDQAFHYMQALQQQAYKRTTATVLARLDYEALAKGFGVGYLEISDPRQLEAGVRGAIEHNGPVLVRVVTDYGQRPLRLAEGDRRTASRKSCRRSRRCVSWPASARPAHWTCTRKTI